MNGSNIFIFSGPIRSGKTTALMRWAAPKTQIGGILTPDNEHGIRVLQLLSSKQTHPLEVSAADAALFSAENITTIGKFSFLTAALALAQRTLTSDMQHPMEWLIIDEIGKLELQGQGLEPAATTIIQAYKTQNALGALLLVVRDSLLDTVLRHYDICKYPVIHSLEILE